MRVSHFLRALIVLAVTWTIQSLSMALAAESLSWNATPGTKLRYRVRDSHAIKHSDARMSGDIEAELTIALTVIKAQGDAIWFQVQLEKFSMQRRMGGERAELDTAKSVVKGMDSPFEPGKELLALAQAYCNRQDLLRVSLNGVDVKLHNNRPLEMAMKTGFQMVDEVVAGMLPFVFVPLDGGAITPGRDWYIVEDEEIFSNRLAQVFHKNTVQTVTRKGTTLVNVATEARGAEKKGEVPFGQPGTTRRQGSIRFNATGHYLESLEITVESAASSAAVRKQARLSSSDTRQIKVEKLDATQVKVPAVEVPEGDAAALIDRSRRRLSDKAAYTAGLKVLDQSPAGAKLVPAPAATSATATPNPLSQPPEGHQIATKETPLLPGMPVRIFHGGWQEAEFVAKRGDILAVVSHKFFTDRDPIIRQVPWNLIAVSDATLQQGREKPDSFHSSYRLLKDGSLPLEKDSVPVTAEMTLTLGTQLKLERAGRWVPSMVASPPENGRVTVIFLEGPRIRQTLSITEFAIDKSTLELLGKPGAAETLAKALESIEAQQPTIPRIPARAYAISQPMPSGTEKLSADVSVPKDTKLQIQWGARWHSATVLEESKTGDVKIRWDDFKGWDEPVTRDSLIIDQKLQAKLARATGNPLPKAKTPDPTPPAGEDLELVLESFGTGKIAVTKVVMEITGFNLKDAKETVESAPIVLKDGLSKAEAERLQQQIESAGGKAKVQVKGR